MPDIDYANQIANLIKQLAPYSNLGIGDSFQAISVEINSNKVYIELESENYQYLSSLINDTENPNNQFTVSGFYLKNYIKNFLAHPDSSIFKFAFVVDFKYPHKFKTDQEISLKGFTNSVYSTDYKVLKIIDAYTAILYPISAVPIVDISSGLGYIPTNFTVGLNGIKTFSDEGTNTISYEIDPSDFYTVASIDDVDQDYDIFVNYYNENVKVLDLQTFLTKLTDSTTTPYLIVDTTSLSGSQNRSRSNRQDSGYNSYGRVGFFEKNYTITLNYVLERNTDDSNNQTSSGSDIVKKQVDMHDALLSILRESLEESSGNKIFTSLTIISDGPPITVSEGRFRIPYELGFTVFYNSDILLDKDENEIYKINSVKFNNNVVDFS